MAYVNAETDFLGRGTLGAAAGWIGAHALILTGPRELLPGLLRKQVVTRRFLCFFSLAICSAFGQTIAPDAASQADAFFQALTAQKKFSGAVMIAKDGQPILAKAYGMANYEWQTPNTIDTRFRVGSITKQFTAAAILKLEEQGKLKTGDAACQYLPECPEAWKPITVHQLLTHTSGIKNFTAIPAYSEVKVKPSRYEAQVKVVLDYPLEFAPGEKFNYSNTGYLLLGKIIEKASGLPFEAYFEKEIFAPAGMTSTTVEAPGALIPKRAEGYRSNGGKIQRAPFIDMRIPGAAGAVLSTVGDLVLWERALSGNKVISAASRARMLTVEKGNYGYGTTVEDVRGKKLDGHDGGIDGFVSTFQRFGEDGLAIVVLSNFEDMPGQIVEPALQALATGAKVEMPVERKAIALPSSTLDEYLGRYELAPNFILTITREGDQLITQATGQGKIPVYAEAKDILFPTAMPATLRMTREDGKVTGLVLQQGGREMPAKRLAN